VGATLVQQGASVMCSHGGQATPTVPNPRVRLGGSASLVVSGPWTVAGCPLVPPAVGPCVTAMWTVGTVRVRSLGQPLVLGSGSATCAPTGTPLQVLVTQMRVSAS